MPASVPVLSATAPRQNRSAPRYPLPLFSEPPAAARAPCSDDKSYPVPAETSAGKKYPSWTVPGDVPESGRTARCAGKICVSETSVTVLPVPLYTTLSDPDDCSVFSDARRSHGLNNFRSHADSPDFLPLSHSAFAR